MSEEERDRFVKILVIVIVIVFLAFWAGYHAMAIAACLKVLFG